MTKKVTSVIFSVFLFVSVLYNTIHILLLFFISEYHKQVQKSTQLRYFFNSKALELYHNIIYEVSCLFIGEAVKLRIIELCEDKNITINKLTTISGITQSTLSNIISGRNNSTTISTIKKICDGFEISIQEFFVSGLFENLEQEIR